MTCSSAIQKLYGELAASIVRATTGFCDPHASAGARLHGPAVSAFQGAYIVLRRLQIASLEDILLVDGNEVKNFIVEMVLSNKSKYPLVDEVLEAWLSLFVGQLEYASSKRLPFKPHQDIKLAMDALASCGYAQRSNTNFIWTDEISRAMLISGLWNEDGFSWEELNDREIDLDMRNALASIPNDVRLSALKDDRVAVGQALATRWIEGVWLADTTDETPWWRLAAYAPEAIRLIELVQNDRFLQIDAVN